MTQNRSMWVNTEQSKNKVVNPIFTNRSHKLPMKLCLLFWAFWVGLDRLDLDVVEEAKVGIIIGRIWIKIFKETLS